MDSLLREIIFVRCSIYVFTRKVIRTRRWDFAVYRVGTCVSAITRGIMGIPVTYLSIGLLVWSIIFIDVGYFVLFYLGDGRVEIPFKGIKKRDVVEMKSIRNLYRIYSLFLTNGYVLIEMR